MTRRPGTPLDDYLAARAAERPRTTTRRTGPLRQLKRVLRSWLPTSYHKRKFRRKLDARSRREMEESPKGLSSHAHAQGPPTSSTYSRAGTRSPPRTHSGVLRETSLLRRNLVLIRDYYRFSYHAGLTPQLPDVASVTDRLRAIRRGMRHVERTFCIGKCVGGYGALLFGHHVRVDVVYAFGAYTRIDERALRRYRRVPRHWKVLAAHQDLSRLLAAHNGRTRYEVFYCEDNARDRDHAESIGDCPGVVLRPLAGDSHRVIEELQRLGRLRTVMPSPRRAAAPPPVTSSPEDGS